MCKYCGIRYCRLCLKGDFFGLMKEIDHCIICNQKKCKGKRVEWKVGMGPSDEVKEKYMKYREKEEAKKAKKGKKRKKGKKGGKKKRK